MILQSSAGGGAFNSGADGTYASGTANGCTCHGATNATTSVTLELDSAGIPVTHYVAGQSYTIKITGTNTSTVSLPKFGFQVTAVKSTGAGTSSATNIGLLQSTGLPAGLQYTTGASSGLPMAVVEHSTRLSPATGTGATGTTYVETVGWTAPATGSGTAMIYGCINAVNGTGSSSGDRWNNATPISITEEIIPSIAPISGTFSVCAGASTTLTDATTGGTWSSSNIAVATVISSTGAVTGAAGGTSTITYTTSSGYVTQVFTVVPLPNAGTISGAGVVCQGASIPLSDASTGGLWTSSSTGVATVGATGTVNGIAGGTTTISYTVSNACGTAVATHIVSVTPLPSAGTITGSAEFCITTPTALTDATTGGTWSSSNTAVATVSGTGLVSGVSGGTATISYSISSSCGAAMATKVVTVDILSAGSISGTSAVCISTTSPLSDLVTGGTWTSSNTAVATIGSSSGIVSGLSIGSTTISYTATNLCGTAVATYLVNVITTPSVAAISGPSSFCQLTSVTLTDATTGGVWTSSNSAIASAGSATGIVNGIAGGAVTITYTATYSCGSASAYFNITVNPLPAVPAISGVAKFCTGTTSTLSDLTTGGTWSSSNTAVATAGTAGLINGLSGGTSTISYVCTNACGSTTATSVVTVDFLPATLTISGIAPLCTGSTIALTGSTPGGVWSSSNTSYATVGSSTGVVTGGTPGSAIISYTLSNTCGSIDATQPVSVNPTPFIPAIAGASKICVGAIADLTESYAGGTWSSGNAARATITPAGFVTGVTQGTVVITYAVPSACGTYNTTHVMTVDPLPTPAFTISGDIFTSTYIYPSYEWVRNGSIILGATYSSYTAVVSGNYALLVTDSNGCTGSSSASYLIATEVNNANGKARISVYPNPVQNTLFIDYAGSTDAEITSTDGRHLFTVKDTKEIDLSTLPNDIYLVSLFDHNTGELLKTKRIVKKAK